MEDIISYRDILEHVQKQFKESYVTSDKYKLEFDQLKAHSDGLNVTQTRDDGWLQYNRCKNRYKDILPYDKTRVRLPVINNIAGSDYINASHISGPDGYVNYIAAQGPLPGTVFDFWRMVWYNYSTVIVMVCKEFEMGKNKCANYWGKGPGDSLKRGNFTVALISEKEKESYIARKLLLKCADVSREVYQYQYLNWPDRDVPSDGEPLNKMLAIVRDKCPAIPTSGSPGSPIVIHCSAGCGRTGTVLAIDYIDILIRNQQLDREFSLFELMKKMRTERVAICQTKQQYGFVYYTAMQLLDSAVEMLNMRSEAISDAIYENVPHSPSLTQEDGTLIELDIDPPPQTKPQIQPQTKPQIQPQTKPLAVAVVDEKPLKPSKPPKPERPKSMIGLFSVHENKLEGDTLNLIGTGSDAGVSAGGSGAGVGGGVSASVTCGGVSASVTTGSVGADTGDDVSGCVGDGGLEEPLYSSVNPFARTGKLLDFDDSPSDVSDDEVSPVHSLTTAPDTPPAHDSRSKPMDSGPPPLTRGPPPPSSQPPPIATPAPRSPKPAVKIRSAPPSSPTPTRTLPSTQLSSPIRAPPPSFPPPSNNGPGSTAVSTGHSYEDVVISHTDLREQDCYPEIRFSNSKLSSDLGTPSQHQYTKLHSTDGSLGERGCYSEIKPSPDESKKPDIVTASKSHDSLLGTQNQILVLDDDMAYSQIFVSGSDNKLTSPRFDDDNYSELSIPHSDVTDGASNIPPSSGDDGDGEDEDPYETFDSADKAPRSKEKLDKANSKIPSSSAGKKSKTKGFGFKGLLANISDNAHSASQNLKTKSQNMNIKSLTGNNNNATVYQDLPELQYVSEFGKRTGSPMGPRDMPSHWIQI